MEQLSKYTLSPLDSWFSSLMLHNLKTRWAPHSGLSLAQPFLNVKVKLKINFSIKAKFSQHCYEQQHEYTLFITLKLLLLSDT